MPDEDNVQDTAQESEDTAENQAPDHESLNKAFDEAFDIPVGTAQITGADLLPDYQKRVVVEHEDLADKIEKLTAFLNDPEQAGKVDKEDLVLLSRQLDIMRRYDKILTQRIDRF